MQPAKRADGRAEPRAVWLRQEQILWPDRGNSRDRALRLNIFIFNLLPWNELNNSKEFFAVKNYNSINLGRS